MGIAQTIPLETKPSPEIKFLADRETFIDAPQDYTFHGGCHPWEREKMDAQTDAIREQLFNAQEARENGTDDSNYCKNLMDLMLANIQREVRPEL